MRTSQKALCLTRLSDPSQKVNNFNEGLDLHRLEVLLVLDDQVLKL